MDTMNQPTVIGTMLSFVKRPGTLACRGGTCSEDPTATDGSDAKAAAGDGDVSWPPSYCTMVGCLARKEGSDHD